jgi:hypothetical protein
LRSSKEYEGEAVECVRLAQSINHAPTKAMLLEMAEEWLRLAQQARQNESTEAN